MLYGAIKLQVMNKATSVVRVSSRIWNNVGEVLGGDLNNIADFFGKLISVYAYHLRFTIDAFTSRLLDTIRLMGELERETYRHVERHVPFSDQGISYVNQIAVGHVNNVPNWTHKCVLVVRRHDMSPN